MKPRLRKAALFLATVLSLASLNSCYFNSAQHLVELGKHDEAVFSAHITPGVSVVMYDGRQYYVELPRYKTGKPIRTQYNINGMTPRQERMPELISGESILVRIPEDFARYLMGYASGPKVPSMMEVVQDEKVDTFKCQKFVVKSAPDTSSKSLRRDYVYRSPYELAWYSLAAFDWMCVDVPMTCVENSLMLVTGIFWPPLFVPDGSTEPNAELDNKAKTSIPTPPVQTPSYSLSLPAPTERPVSSGNSSSRSRNTSSSSSSSSSGSSSGASSSSYSAGDEPPGGGAI